MFFSWGYIFTEAVSFEINTEEADIMWLWPLRGSQLYVSMCTLCTIVYRGMNIFAWERGVYSRLSSTQSHTSNRYMVLLLVACGFLYPVQHEYKFKTFKDIYRLNICAFLLTATAVNK